MMPMGSDQRISVQSTCSHGVHLDGSRNYILTQRLPITPTGAAKQDFRTVETHFAHGVGLDLRTAIWEIKGRRVGGDDLQWWELKRDFSPARCSIGRQARGLVEWRSKTQTAGVCPLCAIEIVKEEQ